MRRTPNTPIVGEGLSANFARDIIRELRASRIIAGKNITVDYTPNGTRINGTPGGVAAVSAPAVAKALVPFTVRWMSYDTDAEHPNPSAGQWQIYLPMGCASITQKSSQGSVESPYIPKNNKAQDADGNLIAGWYAIPTPTNGTDDDATQMDGKVARSWSVGLYMKPWARMVVSAMPSEINETFKWVVPVATIGTVTYSQGSDGTTPPMQHTVDNFFANGGTTTIEKEWDASGDFGIKYEFASGSEKTPNATPKAYLVNQRCFLGRLDKILAEDKDISSWNTNVSVWVKIQHDSTTFAMSVEKDLSGSNTESDDDKTVHRIYTLKGLIVTADERSDFPSMSFYTSAEAASPQL